MSDSRRYHVANDQGTTLAFMRRVLGDKPLPKNDNQEPSEATVNVGRFMEALEALHRNHFPIEIETLIRETAAIYEVPADLLRQKYFEWGTK